MLVRCGVHEQEGKRRAKVLKAALFSLELSDAASPAAAQRPCGSFTVYSIQPNFKGRF